MFVAFVATVHGFLNGCRPLFGVDGTFLNGPFKGMPLTAVSVDGKKEHTYLLFVLLRKRLLSHGFGSLIV